MEGGTSSQSSSDPPAANSEEKAEDSPRTVRSKKREARKKELLERETERKTEKSWSELEEAVLSERKEEQEPHMSGIKKSQFGIRREK